MTTYHPGGTLPLHTLATPRDRARKRAPLPGTAGDLPLFTWARHHAPQPCRPSGIRLLLLENCRDADGEARPALVVPGHRLPMIYPSIATALAAKASMEARW